MNTTLHTTVTPTTMQYVNRAALNHLAEEEQVDILGGGFYCLTKLSSS